MFSQISDNEIIEKFGIALNRFFKNDSFLLKNGTNDKGNELETLAHERSITHKLAEYLQEQFTDWNVDCEYNRHELKIKTQEGDRVYPDIIVHHRGIKHNLFVIELKSSSKDNSNDLKKLVKFTKSGEYHYQLGLFIRLTKIGIKELKWYQNGLIKIIH